MRLGGEDRLGIVDVGFVTLAAQLVDGRIDGHALEPAAKRRVTSVAADCAEHFQKYLLHQIFGLRPVAEYAQGQVETRPAKARIQAGERLHVASLGACQSHCIDTLCESGSRIAGAIH